MVDDVPGRPRFAWPAIRFSAERCEHAPTVDASGLSFHEYEMFLARQEPTMTVSVYDTMPEAPARSAEHADGRFCNIPCGRCEVEFARQAARNTARRNREAERSMRSRRTILVRGGPR